MAVSLDRTDLETQLAFDALISNVSARLIAAPDQTLTSAIDTALEETARLFAADRGQIFSASRFAEDMPWAADQIGTKRQPIIISALDELPPEAQHDRASLAAKGMRSAVWVPIAIGPDVRYVLSLEATHEDMRWLPSLVHRLPGLGEILGHSAERSRVAEAQSSARDLVDAKHRATIASLEAAIDAAGLGCYVMADHGETAVLDDRMRDLFGIPPEEEPQIRTFWLAHVHPDDRDLVIRASRDVIYGGIERLSRVYRYQHPTRGLVWYQHTTRTFERAPSGEATRVAGVVQDITEQKRTEAEIREREARLSAAAELAGFGFYDTDVGGGEAFVDDRFRTLCGIPPDLVQGQQAIDFWMAHIHADDRPLLVDAWKQIQSAELDRNSVEYRFLHPCRGERWFQHVSAVVGRSSGAGRTFGVLRDITESKRAEEELTTLSRHLIQAQEAERALLARDLHDDVTQRMAVLAIEVGRAESSAPEGLQSETLKAVRQELIRLSEDIHSLAYRLHPSVLQELGLVEALRTECERKGRHGGVRVTLDLDAGPTTVGQDSTLCLYRVAQEALNNVARHASAHTVGVVLRQIDGGLLLAVNDDGVGFDPGERKARGSLGLVSMRERLRLVHGTLEVESTPGHGTLVVAWVPGEGGAP